MTLIRPLNLLDDAANDEEFQSCTVDGDCCQPQCLGYHQALRNAEHVLRVAFTAHLYPTTPPRDGCTATLMLTNSSGITHKDTS